MKRVGLYEDKNKKVEEYSKGMKVRLNFVRAMLNNPKILFLDEPTNGLDPHNSRILKEIIKEYQQEGGAVLLTTHLMNDVDELCDRVAFMANGKIVEIDTPKNLKLKYGERRVDVEYREEDIVKRESFDLDSLKTDENFMNIIKTKDIVTIHSKEMTLDDIFIKVTGGVVQMNNFTALLSGELQRMKKYNILIAGLFVAFIWIGVLYFTNIDDITSMVPLLIFIDATSMSMLLVGVTMFYEKQEGTIKTLLVSPP